jgi:hypothetical protein
MMRSFFSAVGVLSASALFGQNAFAAPPVPSGSHPRLFASQLAALKTAATTKGTSSATMVQECQAAITTPSDYSTRGGSDGNNWPETALACAFSYLTTGNTTHLSTAIQYWQTSLNDDQKVGDGLGCVAGVGTDWETWAKSNNGSGGAPPIILTVTHDTDYAMRWYGPSIALVYDWLNGAPGVTPALLAQTQVCLGAWNDFYTGYGYHNQESGANYNAGYIVAKAFAAVALGNDNGNDGHLWTQIVDNDFATLLVGKGLSGATGTVGQPAGNMVGGDWGEGWEYAPLSTAEYAAATNALESNGAPEPEMDAWNNSLVLRTIYGTTPTGKFQLCGPGDCDITTPNVAVDPNELDAVLVGTSSDQAASWAANIKKTQSLTANNRYETYIYNALAEARSVTPADYTKQSTPPPLWYLASGTREMYTRTSWTDANAFWAVLQSAPFLNTDHQHFAASSFVFSRGADDLIVDSAPYGGYATINSNALNADTSNESGSWARTQTIDSKAELLWARGTADATYAARSDIQHAFDFNGKPSDLTYAHRDWAMLPEGEVVTVDRVHTSAASNNMYVQFHVNTGGGGLTANGGNYSGKVGNSQVVIHPVSIGSATPVVSTPTATDCSSYPGNDCDAARFKLDVYRVTIPGTWATAVHVIDGLASTDSPAQVDSINDSNIDPGSTNSGVMGASVFRSTKQSYVVASSAQDGAAPATMTYSVPGASPGRHVVFDAAEASDGTSAVTATVSSGRCAVSITAGSGKGLTGHPLMFTVDSAANGCKVSDSTAVSGGTAPPGGGTSSGGSSGGGSGGGTTGSGSGGGSGSGSGGTVITLPDGGTETVLPDGGVVFGAQATASASGSCGCELAGATSSGTGMCAVVGLMGAVPLLRRRRRKNTSR